MSFTLEITNRTQQNIFVALCFDKSGEFLDLRIDVIDFYLWLDRKDRLEWVHDSQDHNNEHIQETGRYKDGYQFWRLADDETKLMNLKDYIVEENIIDKQFENSEP